jgi:hypothetical protein
MLNKNNNNNNRSLTLFLKRLYSLTPGYQILEYGT